MIHQMSRRITRSLINNDIIKFDDVTIYQYGLEVILLTAIKMIGILILAIMSGYVMEAFLFVMAFSSVRVYAGGYHASSVLNCFLLTVAFIAADILFCSLIQVECHPWLIVAVAIIAFIVIYLHSPVAVKSREITEEEEVRFRKLSINITFTYLVIIVVLAMTDTYLWYTGVFSVGVLFEALTLMVEKYRKEIGK